MINSIGARIMLDRMAKLMDTDAYSVKCLLLWNAVCWGGISAALLWH